MVTNIGKSLCEDPQVDGWVPAWHAASAAGAG